MFTVSCQNEVLPLSWTFFKYFHDFKVKMDQNIVGTNNVSYLLSTYNDIMCSEVITFFLDVLMSFNEHDRSHYDRDMAIVFLWVAILFRFSILIKTESVC